MLRTFPIRELASKGSQEKETQNVVWHHATVTRQRREALNGHRGSVVWLTGLSGAGKSTLAHAVEERLYQRGCRTYVLDGDNVRHGLSSNLGFTEEDRKENIRRIGEVAKLMMEAGNIVFAAFISPYAAERENVRRLMPHGDFLEVYCKASLTVCEQRDPKGLYKKARSGEIQNYTGITSPYEAPRNPELILDTEVTELEECVAQVVGFLERRGVLHLHEQQI